MKKTNDSQDWINKYLTDHMVYNTDTNSESYQCVLRFTLLWNLFEAQYLPKHCSFADIQKEAERLKPSGKIWKETLNCFIIRYCGTAEKPPLVQIKELFEDPEANLDHANTIRKKLLNDTDEKSNLSGCLAIIYRIRCNLFHGNKKLATIWNQGELFEHINQFLICIMDDESNKLRE